MTERGILTYDGMRLLAELNGKALEETKTTLLAAHKEIERLNGALTDERMEHDLLKELPTKPEVDEFYEGILLEGAHQVQRWGHAHDRSKSAENWFWLVGYLAGKALRSAISGEANKAKHHCISAGTALFQWHKAIKRDESGTGIGDDADLKAKEST